MLNRVSPACPIQPKFSLLSLAPTKGPYGIANTSFKMAGLWLWKSLEKLGVLCLFHSPSETKPHLEAFSSLWVSLQVSCCVLYGEPCPALPALRCHVVFCVESPVWGEPWVEVFCLESPVQGQLARTLDQYHKSWTVPSWTCATNVAALHLGWLRCILIGELSLIHIKNLNIE